MPYVKLDCELLESSLWDWTPERHIFITALLMARPKTIAEPMAQLEVDNLKETGFVVPPGKYGFVNASGAMIIKKALALSHADILPDENDEYDEPFKTAMSALRCLGEPDTDSRSQSFDGRRLVRVDGGYIVLNYYRYRDKDHTATERKQRQRANESQAVTAVTSVKSQQVTQAEAEAKAEKKKAVAPKLTDEQWLESLKTNPAYSTIDIPVEAGKCKAWCDNKGIRLITRSRLLNWFNKAIEYGKGVQLPNGKSATKTPRRISADHPDEMPTFNL